jgi:hypothetical protein
MATPGSFHDDFKVTQHNAHAVLGTVLSKLWISKAAVTAFGSLSVILYKTAAI